MFYVMEHDATGAASIVSDPITLWVISITGVLILVISSMEKVDNKMTAWLANRRRAKEESEDARVAGQAKDIKYLKDQANKHDDEILALRQMIGEREAVTTALTSHTWEWRRSHAAAGFPYPAPRTPKYPDVIRDVLPTWEGDCEENR